MSLQIITVISSPTPIVLYIRGNVKFSHNCVTERFEWFYFRIFGTLYLSLTRVRMFTVEAMVRGYIEKYGKHPSVRNYHVKEREVTWLILSPSQCWKMAMLLGIYRERFPSISSTFLRNGTITCRVVGSGTMPQTK